MLARERMLDHASAVCACQVRQDTRVVGRPRRAGAPDPSPLRHPWPINDFVEVTSRRRFMKPDGMLMECTPFSLVEPETRQGRTPVAKVPAQVQLTDVPQVGLP